MTLNWVLSSVYSIVIGDPAADAATATCNSFKINKFPCDGKKMDQIEINNHVSSTTTDENNESNRINNEKKNSCIGGFQMPLHYPRYKKADYEKMEEWKLDLLLQEYGLSFHGDNLEEKKKFAMGAFLWPDQI